MSRNAAYMASDLKLWKSSVVFQSRRIPENRAQMIKGANSRRAYFLCHGKFSMVLFFSFLNIEGRSGTKLL